MAMREKRRNRTKRKTKRKTKRRQSWGSVCQQSIVTGSRASRWLSDGSQMAPRWAPGGSRWLRVGPNLDAMVPDDCW